MPDDSTAERPAVPQRPSSPPRFSTPPPPSHHDPTQDPTMPPPSPTVLGRVGVVIYTAACTTGLLVAASLQTWILAAVVLAMQLLLVVVFWLHRRPTGPWVTLVCGVLTAIAADFIALWTQPLSLNALAYVLAGAFGLSVVGQLLRKGARAQATVSMGAALLIALLTLSYAFWIGLLRTEGGQQTLLMNVIAVGAGVMAARACDITLPKPRVNRQVPRGALGVVIGGMVGTAVTAYAAAVLPGPDPTRAAIGGLIVALVGVLADLSAGYFQAGRRIAVDGVALWPVRHGLGPLLAFAAAAPVAHLLSVYYIIGGA